MEPKQASRIIRRISQAIQKAKNPSKSAVAADLKTLQAAVRGETSAINRISSKFKSAFPAMGELDTAFRTAGYEPPEMSHIGHGKWIGKFAKTKILVNTSPNGKIQKLLVASRPVSNWGEAIQACKYHSAMADNGTPDDPEDIEAAKNALHSEAFHCQHCDGRVEVGEPECSSCGQMFVCCPGCDLPYPMEANLNDHCPICGYSSWGGSDDEITEVKNELISAATEVLKTRKEKTLKVKDTDVSVSVQERGGYLELVFVVDGISHEMDPEDYEEHLTDMLIEPLIMESWTRSNKEMMAQYKPRPWTGGGQETSELGVGETTEVQGSGSIPYVIKNVDGKNWTCTCPAWKHQKTTGPRTCKHLKGLRGEQAEAARIKP